MVKKEINNEFKLMGRALFALNRKINNCPTCLSSTEKEEFLLSSIQKIRANIDILTSSIVADNKHKKKKEHSKNECKNILDNKKV